MGDFDDLEAIGVVGDDASNSQVASTNENPQKEESEDTGDKKSGKKSKKKSSNIYGATILEVIGVVALIYLSLSSFGSKVNLSKFAPFKATGEGYIGTISEVVFVGTAADKLRVKNSDAKYCTEVTYKINGSIYTSYLYSVKRPSYDEGDHVKVTVDATKLTSIISIEVE